MAKPLKDMLNQVLAESSFLERANFAGSSDPDAKQMVAIANRVVEEIRDYFEWPTLRKKYTVDLQTGQPRYTLPSDYRTLLPDSAWEADGGRPVDLPVQEGSWYLFKFSSMGTNTKHLLYFQM